MLLRFDGFELDAQAFELRRHGTAVAVEPQVLALILLLAGNRDRLVTRDEIFDKIWNGRIVSDAALSSRIKSARHVLGDDGESQRLIRTVHGRGFRFVGRTDDAAALPASDTADVLEEEVRLLPALERTARPSIAVVPFRLVGTTETGALLAEALPHELIAELSRLRWLFVIARSSSFRFDPATLDVSRIGTVLGARYCLSGAVEADSRRIMITVELADTRDHGIVWAERYTAPTDEIHDVRVRIVADVIAALDVQIPAHEAQCARLSAPENLDAWAAYHLGLQRLYRFNHADNAAAIAIFEQAVAKERDFARAYAALSFAHFQNAFLNYTANPAADSLASRRFAERALECDMLDPFALATMGRSLWLSGEVEASLGWLDRAVVLNPNYAQGIYARAWAETVLGHGEPGQQHADQAMALSPIDPLHYAMLATRALSHLVRGEDREAANWADRAARAPGAHVLIAMIAVACHVLNGDAARARRWVDNIRSRSGTATRAHFFRSFPFDDLHTRQRLSDGLAMLDA